jgi:thiol-disulfide isomerase/thioredoxin
MRRAVPFLLAVVAALVIFETGRYFAHRTSRIPSPPPSVAAPDLAMTDLDGNHINTGDYRGKVLLVNFWAAWCVPCAEEIPQFMRLQQKYENKLQVIGISIDDNESELRSFYKNHKMNYPVIRGDQQIADGYGGVPGLPTTYIIDQEKHIRRRLVGATDFQKLEQEISSLLKAPNVPVAISQ